MEIDLERTKKLTEPNQALALHIVKSRGGERGKLAFDFFPAFAKFAEVSALEATRTAKNQKLQDLSIEGLKSSVEGFEQSHPKLVQVVDSISRALSNLGI